MNENDRRASLRFGWTSLFVGFVLKVVSIATAYRPTIFGLSSIDFLLIAIAAMLFAIALAVPWLMGFSNVIGWLIIGFGVYQAWIMNKYTPLEFKGPFDIKRR